MEYFDQQRQKNERDAGSAGHAERQNGDEGDKRADHEDVAMGEVDHADDAVDHRVADGDQAVDGAKGDAVDQLLNEIFHDPILPARRRVAPPLSRYSFYPLQDQEPGSGQSELNSSKTTLVLQHNQMRPRVARALSATHECDF